MAEDVSPDQPAYAEQTQKLREAAKWLLAAAAAVGALLVAGLQLGSLGELTLHQWPRILVAVAGLAVALGGVAFVIAQAGVLLTQDWVTLAELAREDARQRVSGGPSSNPRKDGADAATIWADVGKYKEELYGSLADTPEDLYLLLKEGNKRARHRAAGGPAATDEVTQRDRDVRVAVQTVVEFANYRRTQANYKCLQKRLLWASVAVVLGVSVFAVVAHPPKKTEPSVVQQFVTGERQKERIITIVKTLPPTTVTLPPVTVTFPPNGGGDCSCKG